MFKEKLARVIHNVDGSIGCLLIGFDGIQIDSVYADEEIPEMSAIAIEVSNLLDKFRRMQLHDIGEVNEVSITTGEVTALARVVADEYCWSWRWGRTPTSTAARPCSGLSHHSWSRRCDGCALTRERVSSRP